MHLQTKERYRFLDFPRSPVVKHGPVVLLQGAQVRSPVRELRSHMLHSAAKKKKNISSKHQKLQEARKDSLLESLERAGPCQYFDLELPAPRTVRQLLSVFLSHPVLGTLLQ